MKKTIICLLVLSIYHLANAQSGTLDPTFGNNGFITSYSSEMTSMFTTFPRQGFVLPDGKFIMVLQANSKTKLTRRLSNGNIDLSYGTNGYSLLSSIIVTSAALQPDGKVVVAGTTDGTKDFILARYNANGTLDPTFGNNGVIVADMGSLTDFLNAVVITSDGKIIAGGSSMHNGHNQFVLAQFTSAGQPDNSFGNNGIVFTDFNNGYSSINSLAVQPDGKIIAGGVAALNNASDFALSRYNADGSPDLSFNLTGKTTSDFSFQDAGRSIVVNADGKIYLGGQSMDGSGLPHFTIARYSTTGTLDLSFNPGFGYFTAVFGPSFDFLNNIRLQSDGKIVASGHTNLNSGNFEIQLIRVNTNGTIDNSFGTNGNGQIITGIDPGFDESGYLFIQSDGKIVTGGTNLDFTSPITNKFTGFRFNTDGTPDASFGNGGNFTDYILGSAYSYNSLFKQNDGKLLAVGQSNSTTGSKLFISRFNANGTPDNTYGQDGTQELSFNSGLTFFQPDGKFLELSVSFVTNADIKLSRYNPDGSLDANFGNGGTVITDLGSDEFAGSMIFQPDGKIIVAGGTRDFNGSDFLLLRYNDNGTVDNSFGIGGHVRLDFANEDNVESIAIASNGKIVFSGSTFIFPPDFSSIHFHGLVVRLNSDGTFDLNFGDQGKVIIDDHDNSFTGNLLVQSSNKIVFVRSEITDGTNFSVFLNRLNEDGSRDNSFGQNGNTPIDGFVIQQHADQKIVVLGTKINNRNNSDFSLARFNAEGIDDLSFGTNGKVIMSFTGVDNFLNAGLLDGAILFTGGSGVDEMGINPGIIAKFRLEPERTITCPSNKILNSDNNVCTATVNGIDPIVTPAGAGVHYTLTGTSSGSGNGSASGLPFNKGTTTVTYTLADDETKSCSFTVTVEDVQLPSITNVSASQTTLWPANHKMTDITVNYSAADNCGIASTQVSVTSNEPVQTSEPEDVSPDWEIVDDHHIRLRAERLESGNGRIYTITITATDINGNQKAATTTINVPKSLGNPGPNLRVDVSPNPSRSYFTVKLNSNSNERINLRVLNNKGAVLNTIKNLNAEQLIKVGSQLIPGMYFIEVTQGGTTKTVKIIKQ